MRNISINTQIEMAYVEFVEKTNIAPTELYLGIQEHALLLDYVRTRLKLYPIEMQNPGVIIFSDMFVHKLQNKSFLKVGI